jgi:asparagine synthase (glutamine-hydrolysing)
MPMASADGRFHIVYNGEIYNRLDLRANLVARGVVLRTTTDTEVILKLWELEGPQMLDRLDGMFAFAIWDSAQRELFAARDRVGEKPFYYALRDGQLFFASEPKALFAGGVRAEFDTDTWTEIMTFSSVVGERTPYRGVKQLLPGHWLRVGTSGTDTGRWWRFPAERTGRANGEIGSIIEASVGRRLIADVGVGTLLSGGLDSSAITAVATSLSERKLAAFTVRYDVAAADEGEYATAAAEHIGVDHHEVRVPRDDLPALIADAAWHLDEPLAFNATGEMLAVSRYARRFVRVLLTGESADELFGGYGRVRLYRYPWLVSLTGRPLAPFRQHLRYASRWHRAATAVGLSRAEWIAGSYANGDPNRFTSAPLAEWAPYRAAVAADAVADYADPVLQALAYERMTHLPSILATGDRMTMGAGMEARLPFTDPRLLDYSARATKADLFQGPHGKKPLRMAMAGRLPAVTLDRRKRGWTSPYAVYLRQVPDLRNWLSTVAAHEVVAASPLGETAARRTIDAFLAGDDRQARDAWTLGRIVLWHQVCIEGRRYPIDGAMA